MTDLLPREDGIKKFQSSLCIIRVSSFLRARFMQLAMDVKKRPHIGSYIKETYTDGYELSGRRKNDDR